MRKLKKKHLEGKLYTINYVGPFNTKLQVHKELLRLGFIWVDPKLEFNSEYIQKLLNPKDDRSAHIIKHKKFVFIEMRQIFSYEEEEAFGR